MFNKLKQTKDLLGKAKEMKKMQDKLAEDIIEETTNGVSVKMDGSLQLQAVTIVDESLLSDKAKLEANIVTAFKKTQEKVQKDMAKKLKDMGGFDFPGM